MGLMEMLRAEARAAPASGIVSVVDHARGRQGLIPLWVGEGDMPTPGFIREAAAASLAAGDTFYTWQAGIPDLRAALARYHSRTFARGFAPEEFIVVGGGMQAIQLALHAVAGAGDEVVYLSPAWPNFPAALGVAGGRPVPVCLDFSENGWSLDPGRIEAAITPRTRALFINTPSNPTGWTADRDTLQSVLDLARRRGLWIIADEIYTRFFYAEDRAPSLFDIAQEDDRILFVNSFSKNWAMTGWRIGWIRAHPALGPMFENLVQYSTSGVAEFMQRGAVAALDGGDAFIGEQVARARHNRDRLCSALGESGRVRLAVPEGTFYLFLAVEGVEGTARSAIRIVDETGVGLAPGAAFGPGGERFFRLCFNRGADQIEEAADRLAAWIGR
ncbi:pyridoxal phosphate-dependent aminotransferase [Chelativorans intermedius]|uniref:Aminotransferase n=1 Tax=Chelativorans intermedius TaxID=515947 RepID=A0ABV6D6N2_9HYPH|nr:pyridoxal phosphate-dependent aminotransferase [Chelativorans intermedius]MCT8998260.1 pyridoxal phosphate-dependent aminotransferase [Chelativorans intermedius]